MFKLFFIFLFVISTLLQANDKVEIYASEIDAKENTIYAKGEISVIYKDYIINAKQATYNKTTGDLELFDNISLSNEKHYKILGDYAKINLLYKKKEFKPFYILDTKSDVWISADDGNSSHEFIQVSDGILSGCEQTNPLWKMEFTSSNYNTKTQWINIYNARLYIYDLPVFYTPYFGYSISTKRRTGLLRPSLGISDDEGTYFQQPLFIVPSNRWDVELNPQIRTKRGKGIYSTLRFVDTRESSGMFKIGYFKEDSKFFKNENLYNKEHYGYNFNYRNENFLKTFFNYHDDAQSGLYLELEGMNDVDYINLEKNNNITLDTAVQILSKINIFYNTNQNYFATYFKYYQDLTQKSNADTLQQIPTFHYHSYLDTLLKNSMYYNFDIKVTNIQNKERIQNKTAEQVDFTLPITFHQSIFNEYINLSYQMNFYAQTTNFDTLAIKKTDEPIYSDGIYATNQHKFTLSTELAKGYEKFNHVISFGSSFSTHGFKIEDGYYKKNKDFCLDPENSTNQECNFYNIEKFDDMIQLEFTQYIYNKKNQEIFYHRLAQNIAMQKEKNIYEELENEMEYHITSSLSWYNNMFYNYDEKTFSKIFNKLTLEKEKITFNISHLFKNLFIQENPYKSYITSDITYRYNTHYSYLFSYDYDIEENIKKSAKIGFNYEKRCWKFGLSYVENNRPTLTLNGKSSIYDKYLYITIILKPFMSPKAKSSAFGIRLPE